MAIDKKILSEIQRYREINNYIMEQDAVPPPPLDAGAVPPPADAGAVPPAADAGAVPPPADAGTLPTPPQPIDVETDDEVTKLDDEGNSDEKKDKTKEIDVTDIVDSQKKIEKKQEDYFSNLFDQIENLESKLKDMDNIFNKLNSLEAKIEKYREKTPEEKLELRTYDSYPFNQKLSDFFDDKQDEMKKTGKNEYVLTSDDVINLDVNDIKDSFKPLADEE